MKPAGSSDSLPWKWANPSCPTPLCYSQHVLHLNAQKEKLIYGKKYSHIFKLPKTVRVILNTMTTDNIFSTGMKTSVFQFTELKAVSITLQARKQLNKIKNIWTKQSFSYDAKDGKQPGLIRKNIYICFHGKSKYNFFIATCQSCGWSQRVELGAPAWLGAFMSYQGANYLFLTFWTPSTEK